MSNQKKGFKGIGFLVAGLSVGFCCAVFLLFAVLFIRPTEESASSHSLPTRAQLAEAPKLPATFTPRPSNTPPQAFGAPPKREPTQTATPTPDLRSRIPPPAVAEEPVHLPGEQLNFVSVLRVKGWDVQVERVEVMSQLPGIGDESYPSGRYAILFLSVTNRHNYTDTFVPYGSISLFDPKGSETEEDWSASFDAWYYFYADTGSGVEPGETAHTVAAYDLLSHETIYYLGPGVLADSQPNRIRLSIPASYTMAPAPRATETRYFLYYDPPDYDPPAYDPPDGGYGDDSGSCCRVCRKGKACGNTCIAASKTCHVGPGCACDG